jgi:hypothetical protein
MRQYYGGAMATNPNLTTKSADLREIPLAHLIPNSLWSPDRLEDLDELRETLAASRILIPPDVMEVPEGYVVLDGHRRIAILARLGHRTVRCHVLPTYTDPTRAYEQWQLVIEEGQQEKGRARDAMLRRALGLPPSTTEHDGFDGGLPSNQQ